MFEWILEQEIGNLKWVEQLNKDTSIQKQAHIKGRKIREMSVWGKRDRTKLFFGTQFVIQLYEMWDKNYCPQKAPHSSVNAPIKQWPLQ